MSMSQRRQEAATERNKRQEPASERVVAHGEVWENLISRALKKQRPPDGWPERPVKKRKRRKTK